LREASIDAFIRGKADIHIQGKSDKMQDKTGNTQGTDSIQGRGKSKNIQGKANSIHGKSDNIQGKGKSNYIQGMSDNSQGKDLFRIGVDVIIDPMGTHAVDQVADIPVDHVAGNPSGSGQSQDPSDQTSQIDQLGQFSLPTNLAQRIVAALAQDESQIPSDESDFGSDCSHVYAVGDSQELQ